MIPGLENLPAGSSRAKVSAWWMGMLGNPVFATALTVVGKLPVVGSGVGEVMQLLNHATAEQLDTAIAQLQADLELLKSDPIGALKLTTTEPKELPRGADERND